MSGTSMAAPYACGVAIAGWKDRNCASHASAKKYAIGDPDGVSDEIVYFYRFTENRSVFYPGTFN